MCYCRASRPEAVALASQETTRAGPLIAHAMQLLLHDFAV
jgi:hypothetical protein